MKIIFSSVMLALLFVSVFTAAFSLNLAKANDGSQASNIDWWPMFQHDLSHTGASTSNAPATNNTLWSFEAKNTRAASRYFFSPVVVNNLVYASSADGTLYCLNAATGALIWKYVISAVPVDAPLGIPTVAGGIVFVGSEQYQFYALNATTGALIWNFQMDGPIHSSATVVGNLVYVGDEGVYCLNAATGAVVWHNTAPAYVVSSPAVFAGLLYVGGPVGEGGLAEDSIYCLNASDGSLVWNYIISTSESPQINGEYNTIESSPTVVNGLVYMGSYDDNVYCLDAISGALVWKHETDGTVFYSLAVTNGFVYVASENQTGPGYEPGNSSLYCLNAITGTSVWTKYFGSSTIVSSPAIAGDIVFVGVTWGNNGIYGLNATTGAIVWSHSGDGLGESPPVVANGVLYAGTSDTLYAFGGSPIGFLPYLLLSLFIIALLVILLVLFVPRRKSKTETNSPSGIVQSDS